MINVTHHSNLTVIRSQSEQKLPSNALNKEKSARSFNKRNSLKTGHNRKLSGNVLPPSIS